MVHGYDVHPLSKDMTSIELKADSFSRSQKMSQVSNAYIEHVLTNNLDDVVKTILVTE